MARQRSVAAGRICWPDMRATFASTGMEARLTAKITHENLVPLATMKAARFPPQELTVVSIDHPRRVTLHCIRCLGTGRTA